MEKDCNAARCAAGEKAAPVALHESKGIFSFSEREYPPYTPKRKDEGEGPSTPGIARFRLEWLHALRSVGAVYMASP